MISRRRTRVSRQKLDRAVKKEDAIGRIAQAWKLIGDSFVILKSDKELMLLPVFSGVFCVLVSMVVLGGGGLLLLPQNLAVRAAHRQSMSQGMWACLLLFYLVNYFVIAFFNVALVSAASSRLAGGHATINEGLETAWQRKGKILQWALLSATVGILLRMIEERTARLGRFVGGLVGMAWTLASYFVVPVLAAEDVGPAEALQRSADLFRETWGEEVVGGFSFGLIFTLARGARHSATAFGQNSGTDRSGGGRSVRSTLLAFTLHRQRRGARHICGSPLPLRQDQARLAWFPAGRLLDGVAAEALAENGFDIPSGTCNQ